MVKKTKSRDFFDAVHNFKHHLGIYLTFTLDPAVVDKLTEYCSGTMLILHDFRQGVTLENNNSSRICCLPVLNPSNYLFHSKLLLLKSETGAKLITGSANLCKISFQFQKEVVVEKEFSFNKPEDIIIYKQVLAYLRKLQVLFSKEILDETIDKMDIQKEGTEFFDYGFISNEDNSILEEIKNFIDKSTTKERITSIKIASPYSSDSYPQMNLLTDLTSNVSIYLRKGCANKTFVDCGFKVFNPSEKGPRKGFHAKIVKVNFSTYSIIYVGSANFTNEGFFNNALKEGNSECGFVFKCGIDEMNDWFHEGWAELDIKDALQVSESKAQTNSSDCFYAWAQKENKKYYTYFYNPGSEPFISFEKNGKRLDLSKGNDDLDFYITDLLKPDENGLINFYLNGDLNCIQVFDPEEYREASDKNESLFSGFKGLDSLNPAELKRSLEKEGIEPTGGSGKSFVKEPPELEKYFYNVKGIYSRIRSKKSFSAYNMEECRKFFDGKSGAQILYACLHFYKAFKSKEQIDAANYFRETAIKLSAGLDIKNLEEFINQWC